MIPTWRTSLSRSLHLNRSQPHFRYFQLATVNKNGYPNNRTVVFRGFLDNGNDIKIITDLNSQKIQDLANQSYAEICWYFTKTREQFRISGKITVLQETDNDQSLLKVRQHTWQNLSEAARIQFAWPTTGKDRNASKELFSPHIPDSNNPLPNFCLLLLTPEKVDHLQLKGEPQNRYLYILDTDKNWLTKEINP